MGVPVPQREGAQHRHQCRQNDSLWHTQCNMLSTEDERLHWKTPMTAMHITPIISHQREKTVKLKFLTLTCCDLSPLLQLAHTNSFHAVSPHSFTHSTLSSSQIHFPRSHTGWNTLWRSYLTSCGWPTCEGVRRVTLRRQSICSYRIFVNVLAARENELAFSAARCIAGGCRAAGSLYSLYRRCEASTSSMWARRRGESICSLYTSYHALQMVRGEEKDLTSNSKKKKKRGFW